MPYTVCHWHSPRVSQFRRPSKSHHVCQSISGYFHRICVLVSGIGIIIIVIISNKSNTLCSFTNSQNTHTLLKVTNNWICLEKMKYGMRYHISPMTAVFSLVFFPLLVDLLFDIENHKWKTAEFAYFIKFDIDLFLNNIVIAVEVTKNGCTFPDFYFIFLTKKIWSWWTKKY